VVYAEGRGTKVDHGMVSCEFGIGVIQSSRTFTHVVFTAIPELDSLVDTGRSAGRDFRAVHACCARISITRIDYTTYIPLAVYRSTSTVGLRVVGNHILTGIDGLAQGRRMKEDGYQMAMSAASNISAVLIVRVYQGCREEVNLSRES
jgi:hypothetical protein